MNPKIHKWSAVLTVDIALDDDKMVLYLRGLMQSNQF